MGFMMNKTYYTELDYKELSLKLLLDIAVRENIPFDAELDVSESEIRSGLAVTFTWS